MQNKYMRFFFIALLFLLLSTCKKENTEPSLFWGEYSALYNNKVWEGSPIINFTSKSDSLLHFNFIWFNSNGHRRQHVRFAYIPAKVNKYFVQASTFANRTYPDASLFTSLSDGDVFGNKYNLIENDSIEDFIELTSFDQKTLEIKGNFQASFIIDSVQTKFDTASPDTIIITNGIFHGRVNRQ